MILSMKYMIQFSFIYNKKEWVWSKEFYSDNIEKCIAEYLEIKKQYLPKDLTKLKYNVEIKNK